jgi:hypothetical protein
MANGSKFSLDLSKAIARAKDKADLAVRKTVLDVGAHLVSLTPVGDPALWKHPAPKGYIGGRARGSWQHGVGEVCPESLIRTIDPSGAVSNERIAETVPQKAAGLVHYIVNTTPYMQRLEDGWSKQAPNGMVALTVVAFGGIVQAAGEAAKSS